MHLGVLASEQSWAIQDLRRAAPPGCIVEAVDFTAMGFESSGGRANRPWDAVLVRTMPAGTLEQIICRMDILAAWEQAGVVCINPPKAMETAIDKFLTSIRLANAGIPTPKAWCGQRACDALETFRRWQCDVVVKPVFGSRGRGLIRVQEEDLAARTFQLLEALGGAIYLQAFVEHNDQDYRALVVDERIFAMHRSHPADWRKNACRGAQCKPVKLPPDVETLALKGAGAVGAIFAGVDLVHSDEGEWQVIEVNASPSWKALSGCHEADVGAAIMDMLTRRKG